MFSLAHNSFIVSGLCSPAMHALSKLLSTPDAGEDVISILRQAIAEMSIKDSDNEKPVEVKINVKLWGIAGCHELLASLGKLKFFDPGYLNCESRLL